MKLIEKKEGIASKAGNRQTEKLHRESDQLSATIQERIFEIRGEKVMIDRDLAELFQIETKRLNEKVKRNINLFPESFRFELTDEEKSEVVAICDRLKTLKHSQTTYAFTVAGVAMLTPLLKSNDAQTLSIQIIESITSFTAKEDKIKKRIDTLNHRYWKEMTIESSLNYFKEFIKMSSYYEELIYKDPNLKSFEEDTKTYLAKVIDYHKQNILFKHVDEFEAECPFPEDIRGYLQYSTHKIFQPQHLMCKLATIRDNERALTYEFLIEYGLLESDVEIYYGVKAISDSDTTSEEFFNHVKNLSKKWLNLINGKGEREGFLRDSSFYKRHKFTNNASDGTFWISWVRLESNETLGVALKNLKKKVYDKFTAFLDQKQESTETKVVHNLNRFSYVTDILNHHYTVENLIPLNKEAELVLKKIEEATEWRDRNSKNGVLLFKKLKNGLYQSNLSRIQTRIFIEMLYNLDYVLGKYKLLEKYFESDTKLLRKEGINNAEEYFEKMKKFFITCQNKSAKDEIRREEAVEESKQVGGNKAPSRLFHSRDISDYQAIIRGIDSRKGQRGLSQILKRLRYKDGSEINDDFRKSLEFEKDSVRTAIKSLIAIMDKA